MLSALLNGQEKRIGHLVGHASETVLGQVWGDVCARMWFCESS
jgi:hypothetical protein